MGSEKVFIYQECQSTNKVYGNVRETDLNMYASLWLREGEVRRGALLNASESGRAVHRRAIGWLRVY